MTIDGKGNGDFSLIDDEIQDWVDSLEDVLHIHGPGHVRSLLDHLQIYAQRSRVVLPVTSQTPYVNTIPLEEQPPYPGSRDIERRIKSLARWNAMAMVVRENRQLDGIGGHISTYASAATLYEVGFNHFFRGPEHESGGDLVFFQGHASPGIYARAYLEGRLSEPQLENFRRELQSGGGLSSYPHPWLMPDFWQFPTVSMGLGPIMAIYQASFIRYLEDRGLKEPGGQKVWAFLGDGECDEPESLGAINIAANRHLDNLIFVINCNLQRLDGPVRGNSKIIQELEALFRGAGWNVIKVVWGAGWDSLFARDTDGILTERCGEALDGDYQKYGVEGGAFTRQHFFGKDERLLKLVEHLSDDDIWHLPRGGHDPEKVFAAYTAAVGHNGAPSVVLAKTIKGYGIGEAGEGKNISHQQKKLNEEELLVFRDRFDIPISDSEVGEAPFYRPPPVSPEMQYLHHRRRLLGGYVPQRRTAIKAISVGSPDHYKEFFEGTGKREISSTMAFIRLLSKLLRDEDMGKRIVPIVPDEARTFGMEALFRQVGIYSHLGQLYDPVDSQSMLYYKESVDGQILEEGITEAGSISSFIAAGTAHSIHDEPMIPFFIFYSMFGFQRIGDLIWAAGDSRARGFLIGGTAGRTTLNGEGLQHQDGHSHALAGTYPRVISYDPAYGYEIAVIVREGLKRMYEQQEDVVYYFTVENENYVHPPLPAGSEEGILKGIYRQSKSRKRKFNGRVQLLGSGPILNNVIKAQEMLEDNYSISADVWSVTSYNELHRDAAATERWNLLHPDEEPRTPYISQVFAEVEAPGVFVAASDYLKSQPNKIAKWLPGRLHALGTDGFGRSDSREALRDFFEVDARYITLAALHGLAKEGIIEMETVIEARKKMEIDPQKLNPTES